MNWVRRPLGGTMNWEYAKIQYRGDRSDARLAEIVETPERSW